MGGEVVAGFPIWSIIFAVIIGSVIGSFLNMAIYRLPRRISFINPSKSFCPNCRHALESIDLIPLVSWLMTHGKCRYCKVPIASRYFFVELLTAALFSGVWWVDLVATYQPLKATFYMIEVAGLIAVIYIDWELYIIPDELNAFLLVVGVAYQALNHSLPVALVGALAGWGLLWGIALLGRVLLGKDAMGHGDIKMMRGVGALIGPLMVGASLGMAVVLGLVFGLALIFVASKQKKTEETANAQEDEEPELAPETVASLFKLGTWYLLCLDIVALPFPGLYKLIGESADTESIEDEEWKPSLTTIPFGPYLAAGAIACMLLEAPIKTGLEDYWRNATGKSVAEVIKTKLSGRPILRNCILVGVEPDGLEV